MECHRYEMHTVCTFESNGASSGNSCCGGLAGGVLQIKFVAAELGVGDTGNLPTQPGELVVRRFKPINTHRAVGVVIGRDTNILPVLYQDLCSAYGQRQVAGTFLQLSQCLKGKIMRGL